ncbi:hypothetical protein BDN72DRAFT_617581 [Pluteus cervinus]|uniref:Uncharacterized protein n=1 Tax=Pluteus cervinus TaxID=181527 RepID=A0ACD3A1U7_9AGAR|nr:hypothetical protein BDN72DRAFT_617581 [Pluteus cervinus]
MDATFTSLPAAGLGSATTLPQPTLDPATTLPIELCREIFGLATNQERDLDSDLTPGSPDGNLNLPEFDITSLLIASVSRTWRAMALAFPELWTTMAIYAPTTKAVKTTRLYMSRSGDTAPFTLRLIQTPKEVFEKPDDLLESRRKAMNEFDATHAVMELWFTRVHRWEGICFQFSMGPPDIFLDALEEQLGNLREVSFTSTHPSHNRKKIRKFWTKLHASKSLRTAYWGSPVRTPLMMSAPFEQLTGFTCSLMFVPELFGILSRCHQLQRLTIQKLIGDFGGESPPVPVVLPNLQVLDIESPGTISLLVLFKVITTPALEELNMSTIPSMTSKTCLRNFLARSGCALRQLHLNGIWGGYDLENLRHAEWHEGQGYLDKLERLRFGGPLDWDILKPRRDPQTLNIRIPFPALLTLETAPPSKDGVIAKILMSRDWEGAGLWTYSFNSPEKTLGYRTGARKYRYPIDEEVFKVLGERSGLQVVRTNLRK